MHRRKGKMGEIRVRRVIVVPEMVVVGVVWGVEYG